jgi:hypothetical protein
MEMRVLRFALAVIASATVATGAHAQFTLSSPAPSPRPQQVELQNGSSSEMRILIANQNLASSFAPSGGRATLSTLPFVFPSDSSTAFYRLQASTREGVMRCDVVVKAEWRRGGDTLLCEVPGATANCAVTFRKADLRTCVYQMQVR